MISKVKILDRLISGVNRFFKVNLFARQTVNVIQFNSGGDDYNPPDNTEGIAGTIGDNPANGVVFAWRDSTERKAQKGEKRIYAVKSDGSQGGEIHLKNDGVIEITPGTDLKIVVLGDTTINTTGNLNMSAANIVSTGIWQHAGVFKATSIQSDDGATGNYQSVTVASGIVRSGAN